MGLRHLISISDLSVSSLLQLSEPPSPADFLPSRALDGRTACLLFQQPSTRTVASFASAAALLGMQALVQPILSDEARDRSTLVDELEQLSLISQVLIVRSRSSLQGLDTAGLGAPMVNAGDGSCEHPSQTLLDLSLLRHLGLGEGKTLVLMGNLRDHRVVHSLVLALSRLRGVLDCRLRLVSPVEMQLQAPYLEPVAGRDWCQVLPASQARAVDEALEGADFVYQVPLASFAQPREREREDFRLDLARLRRLLPSWAKVLHPFPRLGELSACVDPTPFNAYRQLTAWGPAVRRRLLDFLLIPRA